MSNNARNVLVGAMSIGIIFVIFSMIYYFEFPDPNPDPNKKNRWWLWALLSTLVVLILLLIMWFAQRQSAVRRAFKNTTQTIAQKAGFVRIRPSDVSNTIVSSMMNF